MTLVDKVRNRQRKNAEKWLKKPKSRKYVARVDKGSNIIYSILVGSYLDIVDSEIIDWRGLAVSRGTGTAANYLFGGAYGRYKNWWYKKTNTTTESHWVRRTAVDLLAFNTFQTPQYGLTAFLGCYVQDFFGSESFQSGQYDLQGVFEAVKYATQNIPSGLEGAASGMKSLFYKSWMIGPTLNGFIDIARFFFGIPSSAKLTELEQIVDKNYVVK
ncbi:MAG: L-alanine exporter AlaE [archaeon]